MFSKPTKNKSTRKSILGVLTVAGVLFFSSQGIMSASATTTDPEEVSTSTTEPANEESTTDSNSTQETKDSNASSLEEAMSPAESDKRITDFTIDAVISENKTISVTETFTYDFGTEKTDEFYREFRVSSFVKAPEVTALVDDVEVEEPTIINQSEAWSILVLDNNDKGWTGVHQFTLVYNGELVVNEIARNSVYDEDESIKQSTVQFMDWEALIPLWKAPIDILTINLTLPEKASYIEFSNTTTNTNKIPDSSEGNIYTYTLNDLEANSNGLVASIQFDNYVFADAELVGEVVEAPEVAPVVVEKDTNKAPSFVLAGALLILAIVGIIFKRSKTKR
jgi:hypothetical protein